MQTDMISGIFESCDEGQNELKLKDGSQLQFVDSLAVVASTGIKKFQYACLVREERMLLVWHDDLQQIIFHATRLEEKLLSLVCPPSQQRPRQPLLINFSSGMGHGSATLQPTLRIASIPIISRKSLRIPCAVFLRIHYIQVTSRRWLR